MQNVLLGRALPDIALVATDGRTVRMSDLEGLTVIYAYPRTSPPEGNAIPGWSEIAGAKGCTPQSCGFRDTHAELIQAGVAQVFGLSTQSPEYQREVVARLHLPFALLSDGALHLQKALDMPTFTAGGLTLLRRQTLIIENAKIENVFDSISDPARNAEAVLEYLKDR